MRIKAKHPLREEFSSHSSGNAYYDSKGHALCAFDKALLAHGFYLGGPDYAVMPGDEGRATMEVLADPAGHFECKDGPECVGYAHFTYYRMSSGRWEVIGYLS